MLRLHGLSRWFLPFLPIALFLSSCGDDDSTGPCDDGGPPSREIIHSVALSRLGWAPSSLPAEFDGSGSSLRFSPEDRAFSRFHRSIPQLVGSHLRPGGSNQVLPSLTLRMASNDPAEDPAARLWGSDEFGGMQRAIDPPADFSRAEYVEFWLNDFTGDVDPTMREGILHIDFGFVSEDWWWPPNAACDALVVGEFETEDRDGDGFLDGLEDSGLDGLFSEPALNENDEPESCPAFSQLPPRQLQYGIDAAADDFLADRFPEFEIDPPLMHTDYLYINGMEGNQQLDSEDLDRNGQLDLLQGYFTLTLELSDTEHALIDIYQRYSDDLDFLEEARAESRAWRLYRIDLREMQTRMDGTIPNLARVGYLRIWYENPDANVRYPEPAIQIAEFVFARDLNPEVLCP